MRKAPPPIWTALFLLIATAIRFLAKPAPVPYVYIPVLGAILVVAGILLAGLSVRRFVTSGTTLRPDAESNEALVETGTYAFSRNPMYLALIVTTLGIAFFADSWPFFAVPVALFLILNFVFIPYEEQAMRRQFTAYDPYTHRVRRWL